MQAGVDEVGRGPWAGPVVTAAVILDPEGMPIRGLTDSKKLSAKRRTALTDEIRSVALAWALGRAEVEEIDRLGIRAATHRAMVRAVEGLSRTPASVIVDGRELPDGLTVPATAQVGADGSVACVSAASVLAKTARDAELTRLDAEYPGYGLAQHKGYGTAQHREALERFGVTPLHRRSFAPIRRLLETAQQP